MSSRDEILKRVRRRAVDSTPLPELDVPGIQFDDPAAKFAEMLKFVGGDTLFVAAREDLTDELRKIEWFDGTPRVMSAVPDVALGNVAESTINDPHDLASIDVAIVPGRFAVAENGAVWVSGRDVRHRALCVLTQRLILVVPRGELVHNMHQAYERLRFDEPGYGVFISGPSKTADIEQSLVIGAHGSRAHIVALVGAS